jgi:hypothetical protein
MVMRSSLVLLALLLAGCGGGIGTQLPIACPNPGLLGEGADLTRYRAGGPQDLTGLDYDARLVSINGTCKAGRGERSIDVTMTAGFSVERGPASEGRAVELPWFVAVLDRQTDAILSRQNFTDRVVFGRNETRASVSSAPVSISLPVGANRRAGDYRILVSFQLDEQDLALNRRRGPR